MGINPKVESKVLNGELQVQGSQIEGEILDSRGNVTAYARNGFGEVVTLSSPDAGVTSFEYDAAGRVVKRPVRWGATSDLG